MPNIQFREMLLRCEVGANLRRVLMEADAPLYNGVAQVVHCRGLGTCGTCSLAIAGQVSPMTPIERWRLSFPPHRLDNQLRLACQCKVLGDLVIEKHAGLWGQQHSTPPSS